MPQDRQTVRGVSSPIHRMHRFAIAATSSTGVSGQSKMVPSTIHRDPAAQGRTPNVEKPTAREQELEHEVIMKALFCGILAVAVGALFGGCASGGGVAPTMTGGQPAHVFVLIPSGVASPRMGARLAAGVASGLRRHGYSTSLIQHPSQYAPGNYLLQFQTVSVRRIPFAQILDTAYQVTNNNMPLHRGSQSRSSSMSPRRLVRGIAVLVSQDVAQGLRAR